MKQQTLGRIQRYQVFLQQKIQIPDLDGEILNHLDFDFENSYKNFLQSQEQQVQNECDVLITNNSNQDTLNDMKLNDQDIEGLLADLNTYKQFQGNISLGGNNFTDQTLIRLAYLIKNGIKFSAVSLRNSPQISFLGGSEFANALKSNQTIKTVIFKGCRLGNTGVAQLIENIDSNKVIEEYHFGELTDDALKYLGDRMNEKHNIKHLGFEEDMSQPWKEETKEQFLYNLSQNEQSKQILSIEIPVVRLEAHAKFIGQMEILCQQNRQGYIQQRSNDFKAKELDTQHPEYFDPDDFKVNAFKFSVKSYLSNVFESLLDESLFYLEKERQNVLRDEEIQKITNEFTKQSISEDICTANGSIFVLAKYLITKTKK